MALVNTAKQLKDYVDDFGNSNYPPIPLKFGDNVNTTVIGSLPGYENRTTIISCSGGLPFVPRHLVATFADGSIHKFPLQNRTFAVIQAALDTLRANDVVCVNLVGENWNNVPRGLLSNDITFKSSPFTDIPSAKVFQSVAYDYAPDIQNEGNIRLTTRIETAPSALNTCQKSNLDNDAIAGGGICSGTSLGVTPRKWIIQAVATKTGDASTLLRRVVRNAIISTKVAADIKSSAENVDGCAYCLGYRGESATNIQNLIAPA